MASELEVKRRSTFVTPTSELEQKGRPTDRAPTSELEQKRVEIVPAVQTPSRRSVVKADWNDPYQINTVLDVLFNEAGLRKEYGKADFASRIQAVKDIMSKQYINPMLEGEFGTIALNTLFSAGETLDVLGNVVKAFTTPLFNVDADKNSYDDAQAALNSIATGTAYKFTKPSGKTVYAVTTGGTYKEYSSHDVKILEHIVNAGRTVNYNQLTLGERVKASIGIGEYGRLNYMYVTGNVFADILLEVASDPATWVTIGGSALAKNATKTVTKGVQNVVNTLDTAVSKVAKDEVEHKFIKQAIEEFATNATNKQLVKEANVALQNQKINVRIQSDTKPFLQTFLGPVAKTGKLDDTFEVKTLADALTVTMKSKGMLKDVDAVTARKMSDILQESLDTTVNRTAIKAMRAVDAIDQSLNRTYKTLLAVSLTPSGIYPVVKMVQKSPSVARWVSSQLTQASLVHANDFGDRSIMSYSDGLPLMERTTRRIKYALADDADLYTAFVDPIYMNEFHLRIAKDSVILSDLVDKFAENADEAAVMLQNYLALAHHNAPLESLSSMARLAQTHLHSIGDTDPMLDGYIDFIDAVKRAVTDPSMAKHPDILNFRKTLTKITSECDNISQTATNFLRQINVMKKMNRLNPNIFTPNADYVFSLGEMFSGLGIKFNPDDFRTLEATAQQIAKEAEEAEVAPHYTVARLAKQLYSSSKTLNNKVINNWINESCTDRRYIDRWVQATQEAARIAVSTELKIKMLEEAGKESKAAALKEAWESLNRALEIFTPDDQLMQRFTLAMDQSYYTLKEEQMHAFMTIITDADLQQAYANLRASDLNNYIMHGLNSGFFSEAESNYARMVLSILAEHYATKGFLQQIATTPMHDETRFAFMSSVQGLYNTTPEKFMNNIDFYVNDIYRQIEANVQNTKYAAKSLSLDAIRTRDADMYKTFKDYYGISGAGHAHTATEDVATTLYLVHDLAKRGDVVAKEILESNKRIISFDMETMNTQTDTRNVMHQTSMLIFQDNKVVSQSSLGLHRDTISDGLMPDRGYLNNTLGIDEEEFLSRVAGNFESEADLAREQVFQLYNAIKDTYVQATDKYDVVIATQNGKGFDLPILQAKFRQYNLKEVLKDEIADVMFLDKLFVYDTLEHNRIAEGLYLLTEAEKRDIRIMLTAYATEMNRVSAKVLFSAPDISDLHTVQRFCDYHATKLVNETDLAARFNETSDKLKRSFDGYTTVAENNRYFRETLIPKAFMSHTEMPDGVRDVWLRYNKYRMRVAPFRKSFGDGGNINPSALLGARADIPTLGYSYFYNKDLVDNYFVTSTDLITEVEASQLMGVSKALKEIANSVHYPDAYVPYRAAMEHVTQRLLQEPEFSYLSKLRTTDLNVPAQYAIFKYLMTRFKDQDYLSTFVEPDLFFLAKQPINTKDFTAMNRYNKFMEEGAFYDKVQQYNSQLESLAALKTDLSAFSNRLDANNMHQASVQLQMSAATSAMDMLESFATIAGKSRENMHYLTENLKEITKDIKKAVVTHVTKLNPDEMVNWLAHSHGLVVVAKDTTLNYSKWLEKLYKEGFAEKNIEFATTNDHIFVWLTKQADWQVQYLDGQFKHYANGAEVAAPDWSKFSMADIHTGLFHRVDVTKEEKATFMKAYEDAYNRLHFITDGAAGASVFESFTIDHMDELIHTLPEAAQKTYYMDSHYRKSQFWQGSQFNHTVLGVNNTVSKLYGGDLISSLANATEYQVKKHATATTYTAAALDESSGIANTAMAEAYAQEPKAVFDYLKQHSEFVLVLPYSSEKSKHGVRVEEVVISKPADLDYAFQNNARIMTQPVYNKLYEVLNTNIFTNQLANYYANFMQITKVGMLTTPGTWARNAYDAFIKNMMSAQVGPVENALAMKAAHVDFNRYQDAIGQLCAIGGGRLNAEDVEPFFKGYTGLSLERFQYIHDFMSQAAAGGEAAVFMHLAQTEKDDFMQKMIANGAATSSAALKQELKNTANTLISTLMTPMAHIEKVARLAEYDLLTKKGFNKTKAAQVVADTHFAYETKTPIEQLMETVMPFYTFMTRNLEYWINIMETQPAYLSILRDVMVPAWDIDQYNPDELLENNGLQRQVLAGNIRLGDTDYFLSTSFSFMNAIQLLTQPIEILQQGTFSPYRAAIDSAMQFTADYGYTHGAPNLSEWIQNTLGAEPSLAQLQDKYGAWTETYRQLYGDKSARQTEYDKVMGMANYLNLIPIVGTILSRFYKTGIFYNDENALGAIGYLTSLGSKATMMDKYASYTDEYSSLEHTRSKIMGMMYDTPEATAVWERIKAKYGYAVDDNLYALEGRDIDDMWREFKQSYVKLNKRLYEAMNANESSLLMYSRLKAALGYKDTSMGDLPRETREVILAIMNGEKPNIDIMPVLKDGDTMKSLWRHLTIKYDTPSDFTKIPDETLNQMYADIAKSAYTITNIMTMLKNDEDTRLSYAIAKNNLGFKDFKLSQLPIDTLELIQHAMLNRSYKTAAPSSETRRTGAARTSRARRSRAQSPLTFNPTRVAGAGTGLYDTHKAVYANYGHRNTQTSNIYEKNYTKSGSMRISMNMQGMSPTQLSFRRKDMFYYFK